LAIINFPPIHTADEQGLLAVGGDLSYPSLKLAYSRGIFPWPISEDYPLAWFSPDPRGVLLFDNLHIPKKLQKEMNRNKFTIKFNTAFEEVILSCARSKNRKESQGTWITDEIIYAYIDLFKFNHAYSVEAYTLDESGEEFLAGGLYGVVFGGMVSGESMFYKVDNASKIALVALCQYLKKQNVKWIDTQMVTGVVKQLGGSEIPRKSYLSLLEEALLISPPSFEN
jgi:leucyl/phenylalanyl-tRNA---protein transferase